MAYRASQRQLIPNQPCTPVPNTQQAARVVAWQGTKYPQEMWVLERGREVAVEGCVCASSTHHSHIEDVEQIEGQSSDQIHEEPGGHVMDADGARVIHNLARLAHVRCPEVQDDICPRRAAPSLTTPSVAGRAEPTSTANTFGVPRTNSRATATPAALSITPHPSVLDQCSAPSTDLPRMKSISTAMSLTMVLRAADRLSSVPVKQTL